jgi:hypothetical protein
MLERKIIKKAPMLAYAKRWSLDKWNVIVLMAQRVLRRQSYRRREAEKATSN